MGANCDRLGIHCVKSYVYDGVKAVDPDKLRDAENSEWRKESTQHKPFLILVKIIS